jgi:oxygen-independent coproporphyrinogen-3 oxidase
LTALPPLSLYIHFPWCVRKCPYCDFNSHEVKGGFPEQEYLDALRTDLEMALPLIWGRKIYTIFIGGGTPACCRRQGWTACCRTCAPCCRSTAMSRSPWKPIPAPRREVQVLPRQRREPAVHRHPELQRPPPEGAGPHPRRWRPGAQAVDIAVANFDNFNLDLMYALPSQTLEEAQPISKRPWPSRRRTCRCTT